MSWRVQPTTNSHFDDEARALWSRLGIDPKSTTGNRGYNPIDPIYRHPKTGSTIFVGNQTAASTLNILTDANITHVVNCTFGIGEIPNFHASRLKYYRFPVSDWRAQLDRHGGDMEKFLAPLWTFIDEAGAQGTNVLVHCLAGAHRAGTTGCAILIRYGKMDASQAVRTAKQLRPIIDPICDFPNFLSRVDAVHKRHREVSE